MVDTVRTVPFLLASLFQDGQVAGSITPQDLRDLIVSVEPPETTITFGATMTWNLDTDPVAKVTLTGNTTITVSNGRVGGSYRLTVIQGGAGSFVPTFSGATILGTATWVTAVGGINIVSVEYSGATRYAFVTP